MFEAARDGDVEALRAHLAQGADVNARDEGDNASALHWAAAAGSLECVQVLVEAGADVIGEGDAHDLHVIGWATCLDEAHAHSAESLRIFRTLHDPKCLATTGVIHARVLAAMGDGEAALAHAESSVAIYRELDFPMRLAHSLCALGCIHATLGHGDAARRALFSGLIEQQRTPGDMPLPELLEGIAALHPGAPTAPQLLGSAAALRERSNLPLPPAERAEHERRHAQVQARHPDTAFDRAFAAGRALTPGDAVQVALALQQSG